MTESESLSLEPQRWYLRLVCYQLGYCSCFDISSPLCCGYCYWLGGVFDSGTDGLHKRMHNGSPWVSDDVYVVSLCFYHYYTSFSHCFFSPLPQLSIELYLGVSFRYTASAIAAAIALRSLLRFVFPLFGEQIFDALGIIVGKSFKRGE